MKKLEDYTDKELDKCLDNLDIKWTKIKIEDDKETNDIVLEIQRNLIEDIKKDTKALYYAFKYLDPELNVLTDEFLEEVVEIKKFAIQYVPKDRINDKMIWILIKGKNPRYLLHVPKERITKEMEDEIINTFTTIGLQKYLLYMSDIIEKETVIRIIQKIRKDLRVYTRKYIPDRFKRDKEILELLGFRI